MNRVKTTIRALVASAALLLIAPAANATEYRWNGGMGQWSETGRWTPAGTPGEGDTVTCGDDVALLLDGNRTVENLVIDSSDNTLVQVVGTGGDVILTVTDTLRNRSIVTDKNWRTVIRGHTTEAGGTLAINTGNIEAVAGRLAFGQSHQQTSRAITGLLVRGRLSIAPDAIVDIFTNGGPAQMFEVDFTGNGGKLLVNHGDGATRTVQIGALTGRDGGIVAGSGKEHDNGITTLRLGVKPGRHDFHGQIRDREDGSTGNTVLLLVKERDSVQALHGASDYSGATTVEAGTLLVNGDHGRARGPVTVNSGATLGGTGTIGGPVTVAGTLASGIDPGTLTLNSDLVLESGATLLVKSAADGAPRGPRILSAGSGTLVLSGTLRFDNEGFTPSAGASIQLLSGWQRIEGNFTRVEGADLPGGLAWDTSRLLSDGVVTVVRR